MVVYHYETRTMIIDGEKMYIEPEIVKKYNLDEKEHSGITGRKLFTEED